MFNSILITVIGGISMTALSVYLIFLVMRALRKYLS